MDDSELFAICSNKITIGLSVLKEEKFVLLQALLKEETFILLQALCQPQGRTKSATIQSKTDNQGPNPQRGGILEGAVRKSVEVLHCRQQGGIEGIAIQMNKGSVQGLYRQERILQKYRSRSTSGASRRNEKNPVSSKEAVPLSFLMMMK